MTTSSAVPNGKLREMLSSCLCLNTRRAARVVTQRYDNVLRPLGLRSTQLPILVTTSLFGPADLQTIADAIVMDATTLSRNLKPLIRAGWLVVSEGEDRRTRVVAITPSGRRILKRAVPLWRQAQDDFVDALGCGRFSQTIANLTAAIDVSVR